MIIPNEYIRDDHKKEEVEKNLDKSFNLRDFLYAEKIYDCVNSFAKKTGIFRSKIFNYLIDPTKKGERLHKADVVSLASMARELNLDININDPFIKLMMVNDPSFRYVVEHYYDKDIKTDALYVGARDVKI